MNQNEPHENIELETQSDTNASVTEYELSPPLPPTARQFASLDDAQLGWFHLRAVIVSGVGFFTDAYDIFAISLALPMIYQVYYPNTSQPNNASTFTKDNPQLDGWIKASTSWGNLVGQLAFGYLGDKLGRKKMYGVELIIMIVATIGSCFSAPAKYGFDILTIFSIWRFLLGIGIGGDYPMSAVITAEFANVKYRGMMIAAVFAMQGIGILFGGLVTVVTLAAMHTLIEADPNALDTAWRIIIGFGVIPALVAVYFRLTIPETPRYTRDVLDSQLQAEKDIEAVLVLNQKATVTSTFQQSQLIEPKETRKHQTTFKEYFGQWKNLKVLLGTCYCWFALDVAWYGLSLNQSRILQLINFNGSNSMKTIDSFYQKAIGALIVAMMGTVPGYWVTVGLVDIMGRKPIQYLGFIVITIILAALAIGFDYFIQHSVLFIVLFTIANFFFNFGPNETTFIIPSEVFPTRFRSTGHGLSAAAGKLGAIIGIQVVAPFFEKKSAIVMGIFAVVMATGIAGTMLVPETKGLSLEELSEETEEEASDKPNEI